MDNTLLIVILAIAVLAIAVAAWCYYQKTSSKHLKERFGPEYYRKLERCNGRDLAE